MNGDDSICMKSPAKHVLVENSLVRQGNGLVIGTSDEADFLTMLLDANVKALCNQPSARQ